MSSEKSILFLSNGHGEDLISRQLMLAYRHWREHDFIYVMPLVGRGHIFDEILDIEVLEPRLEMKSGGFIKSPGGLMRDLFSGLLSHHFRQVMNARKHHYDAIVCVGDLFPLLISNGIQNRIPRLLISTAKSDLFEPHFGVERWFFKQDKAHVFTRDEITKINLRARGVDASYLGNIMMDLVATEFEFRKNISPESKNLKNMTLGILPGSRREGEENFRRILDVVDQMPRKINWLVAIPPQLNPEVFIHNAAGKRIQFVSFSQLLKKVDAVIGLAGTANEQCVGCGLPVFTFPGSGPQTTPKRFRDQQRLLNDCTQYIDSRDSAIIAKTIQQKLKQPEWMERVHRIGPRTMGAPGAAAQIAKELSCIFES